MMILENRQFSNRKLAVSPYGNSWKEAMPILCCLLALLTTEKSQAQNATSVSARFASIKGVVMASTSGGETQVQKGNSIRAGTVITCGLEAGALLRPLPTLSMVIYPESKVRYDGSVMTADGGGSMSCSVLAGKALFHIDPPSKGAESSHQPSIKVTVLTEEGVIVNRTGGDLPSSELKEQGKAGQSKAATWTVQHDEGRTVVAVGEGVSHVSIGKGGAAAGGQIGGQIEVPQGSVIWLFNRGGDRIDAELVDTISGKITNLTGGPSQGGDLLGQSKKQITTPSSSGTATTLGTPTTTPGSTMPTGGPSNPDLSSPRAPLPVVSADTP